MKMNYTLYEKCEITNQLAFLFIQWDGKFVLREPKDNELLLDRFLVPKNNKKRLKMDNAIVRLIRKGKATIPVGYIITPSKKCIKSNATILNQFQKGGYDFRDGIANRRKRPIQDTDENERRQRQRLDEEGYGLDIFDLVNVVYRIYFIMHTTTRDIPRSKGGILRNVIRTQVEERIEQEGNDFIEKQNYDTEITNMTHTIIGIPDAAVPLVNQRMFGTSVNYHYLQVESNDAQDGDCVYQFLVNHYGKWIKNITKQDLLKLFDEEELSSGVDTSMVELFCREFGVSLYALNLEMQVFHKMIPSKRNHNIPPLVYVCGNQHMYPLLCDTARKSIFAR